MKLSIEEAVILCHRVLHIDLAIIANAYAEHGMTTEKVEAIIKAAKRKTGGFPVPLPPLAPLTNGMHEPKF